MTTEHTEDVVQAVTDALIMGVGVMIVRNTPTRGVVLEHVPVDKYLELSDALQWAHQERGKAKQ